MKRLPFLLFICLFITSTCWGATYIFVSTTGSDINLGTKEKPFATLQAALLKARNLRRVNDSSIKDGIYIILQKGIYQILETIIIRPEDSGTQDSPTYIENENDEEVILSGGVQIKNWEKNNAPINGLQKSMQNKIWVADVPMINGNIFNFRQLWVNEKKAIKAKSANADTMHRILNWNKKNASCIIPTLPFNDLQNTFNAEMFIHQWWEIANLRIKSWDIKKDSTILYFHQPESKIQNEHPWPAPWISKETGNSAFYLTNALQFLDEPGEWYLDVHKQKIYYYPRANENMQTANLVAPFTETLISIEGTTEHQVSNVIIQNISFQHTGWLRPSKQGHVPHQAGMYMTEAYKLKPIGTPSNSTLDNQAWVGRQAAAIEISYAKHTRIKNCSFQHLAATAVDLIIGVKDNITKNNLFSDIGGAAIMAGNFGDEGREIHLPYLFVNANEVCDNILIQNNFITNTATEDWGCAAIGLGIISNTNVEHNEIENTSYSGISLGWGWSHKNSAAKHNEIIGNKIHHYGMHNYDCAGIYVLGAQGKTTISYNYIDSIYKAPYSHLPNHWFYLYTDEGSSNTTLENNWTPSKKFLQNANGENNIWINNGPMVNDSVKLKAGLENDYKYLLKNKYPNSNQTINEEHSEVIEIIAKNEKTFDSNKLKILLAKNNIDSSAIYQWNNHFVIFANMQDVFTMKNRIQNNFPNDVVKWYYDVVYNFQKQKYCVDRKVATEWDHILLTANLVANKKMQKEYVDAHTTQFENIPQIAEGFCNASFQQLLVFKNGRQLMLVISIPKGESLDKLNPKTIENNPQMIEWNKRMAKYQEGIEGTKKGESWVFLRKL